MANHKLNNFSFQIAVFLALLNHKFKPEHAKCVMATFVISILVYAITLCTPYFPGAIDDINLLAGRLATVLLTFTLFPRLGWLLLFIWTIHFVKLIYRAVRKVRQQYHATPTAFGLFNQVMFGRHAHHNEQRNVSLPKITCFVVVGLSQQQFACYYQNQSLYWKPHHRCISFAYRPGNWVVYSFCLDLLLGQANLRGMANVRPALQVNFIGYLCLLSRVWSPWSLQPSYKGVTRLSFGFVDC
ncbi:hypothetical protein CXB51_024957 [Gossypium anomalum]|uniref:Uncharacterized protein n=1 Tax=Gossypium anomalum TaxID=47600 RepID=A0A8J5Y9N4_9ROSI|nr:hypothetical protein CXB51_024957 [Gossypium anomalum]